ncbi:MAG: hypothetical protein AAGD10_02395 [Myxococcota bacterium]
MKTFYPALSIILLCGCEDAPDGLQSEIPAAECSAPPLRQLELGRDTAVDLEGANLLTLPAGHHQISRRLAATVQSTDQTAVVPIFCDGEAAPPGCETGFVIVQRGSVAQFLPGLVVTEARPHTAVVIAEDGSVVLQDENHFRIFDGGLVHEFDLDARSSRMTQPMAGVVHIESEFGVLVWADGELQQLVPDRTRVMQTLATSKGLYAFGTDFSTDELIWIERGAVDGRLGARTLITADGLRLLNARVTREGLALEDHQRWFCVPEADGAELQLIDPLQGVLDRLEPASGDCRTSLLHAPGEGLWFAHELNQGDRLHRLEGPELLTTRGFVVSLTRASSGWLMLTRPTNDMHLYTLSPTGEAAFVGQRSLGFRIHEVDGARAAVPESFGNLNTGQSTLLLDRDGEVPLVQTFEGTLLNSSLSPQGRLWVTHAFQGKASLHVLENGEEPVAFEGLALGSAHWLTSGGLLALQAEDESRQGLYLSHGRSLTRLARGRSLQVLVADADGLLVRYFVDNQGTTALARFDGQELQPIMQDERSQGPWLDHRGALWLGTSSPSRAHRVEGLDLVQDALGPSFLRFAHRLDDARAESVWGFVQDGEDQTPCVCTLDARNCSASPVEFPEGFELLPSTSLSGPMAIGKVEGRRQLWLTPGEPQTGTPKRSRF